MVPTGLGLEGYGPMGWETVRPGHLVLRLRPTGA